MGSCAFDLCLDEPITKFLINKMYVLSYSLILVWPQALSFFFFFFFFFAFSSYEGTQILSSCKYFTGLMWCLIVSIPDICPLSYFKFPGCKHVFKEKQKRNRQVPVYLKYEAVMRQSKKWRQGSRIDTIKYHT